MVTYLVMTIASMLVAVPMRNDAECRQALALAPQDESTEYLCMSELRLKIRILAGGYHELISNEDGRAFVREEVR
jgi:hypothetical protein